MNYEVDFSGIVVPDKAHGVEYKEALTRGRTKGRRQEEWYKRRTADRVFAALDATVQGLKLSGSADSADSADSVGSRTVPVPEHQRSFTEQRLALDQRARRHALVGKPAFSRWVP
jgi:hypothetical protein